MVINCDKAFVSKISFNLKDNKYLGHTTDAPIYTNFLTLATPLRNDIWVKPGQLN